MLRPLKSLPSSATKISPNSWRQRGNVGPVAPPPCLQPGGLPGPEHSGCGGADICPAPQRECFSDTAGLPNRLPPFPLPAALGPYLRPAGPDYGLLLAGSPPDLAA